jgi:endonuclease YncB( thermonuclease family)
MNWNNYNYNNTPFFSLKGLESYGRVVQIHDGDTLTAILPLHNSFYKFSIRLAGIDTCEITSKNTSNKNLAIAAKKKLFQLITKKEKEEEETETEDKVEEDANIKSYLNNNICIVYIKCLDFDKYGRILATVSKHPTDPLSISDILISDKLAYKYDGKTKLTEEQQLILLS